MKPEIEALQAENVERAMRDGPRLSYAYNTFILARDRKQNRVLLGGLGCLGVGQMWFSRYENDDYANYPGFDDAPEQDSAGDFGTPEANEKL